MITTYQIGNTPMGEFEYKGIKVHIKLESYNPSGSMKDRAATHILEVAKKRNIISQNTTIIESSSGNFGIALAMACKRYNLKFICVIDNNTNNIIEKLLKIYDTKIVKVTKEDQNGGFLVNRIKKVKNILDSSSNMYWTNQYANVLNAKSYYSLAEEILNQVNNPDFIFVPVSSGGTITGISTYVKLRSPKTKIIAVDSEGSVIFGGKAQKRYIPGMGSSIKPSILQYAKIDEVLAINEVSMISECREFVKCTGMLIGGSSGACLYAIKQYYDRGIIRPGSKVVAIFPDRGDRYIESIYDDDWCYAHYRKSVD